MMLLRRFKRRFFSHAQPPRTTRALARGVESHAFFAAILPMNHRHHAGVKRSIFRAMFRRDRRLMLRCPTKHVIVVRYGTYKMARGIVTTSGCRKTSWERTDQLPIRKIIL